MQYQHQACQVTRIEWVTQTFWPLLPHKILPPKWHILCWVGRQTAHSLTPPKITSPV